MSSNTPAPIKTTPDNFTAVTPWIINSSSEKMIQFMEAAFGAQEVPNARITNEEGIIIHTVAKVGSAMVLLFDAREGWGPTPSFLNLYVNDIESVLAKAVKQGASSVTDITELWFWEKVCRILDPFGNLWWINQRVKEIDFTDPKNAERANAPEAIEGIKYIQTSLNEALLSQKEFFKAR